MALFKNSIGPAGWLHRRGSVAIEYALILPALLMLVFGIIDTGRVMWTYTTLYRATEAAARCAAINTVDCATDAQVQNRAVAEAWGLAIDASAFTITAAACGHEVKGAYDFQFIIPLMNTPLGTVTLRATACYPANT